MQEFASAFELLITYIQQEYEAVLPRLFNSFNLKYPNSIYTNRLVTYNGEVLEYYRKSAADFSNDQYFIKSQDSIATLESLAKQFHGHYVYVDIWATWCGPCKNEFSFKDSLYGYLNSRDIRMVYISIDFNDRDAKWKEMIKYYGLKGYHIRASKSLNEHLRSDLGATNGLTIPRYLLINREGTIVESDALRPSDGQKLFTQIANLIDK